MLKYTKENITGLKGEDLYSFFHNTIIPELIEQEKEETNETLSKKEKLKQYGLTTLCLGTIYKWMGSFGFKFCLSKKTYYVDGHERPETVAYRKEYVSKYLRNEIRCFQWIQLSVREIEEIEKENDEFDRKKGYEYVDPLTGLTMYEFHVDDVQNTHEKLKDTEFGGFLSVRKKMRTGLSS